MYNLIVNILMSIHTISIKCISSWEGEALFLNIKVTKDDRIFERKPSTSKTPKKKVRALKKQQKFAKEP